MSVSNRKRRPQDRARSFSEQELASSRFLALVQESADVFWMLTPQGEVQEVCASWQTFTGQKEREYRGRGWHDALHPAEQAEIDEGLMQAVATRQSSEVTCQIRHHTGRYRLLHVRIIPVRVADGSVGELVLCGKDITKRKLSMRMNEAQVRLALKASRVGMWDWDLVTDQIALTDQCKVLFGWSANAHINYQNFLVALHPDDRKRLEYLIDRALSEQAEFRAQYRVIWPDGSVHWLVDRARGIYNARGKAVHMVGACIDITDLKQAQEQACESDRYTMDILERITDIFACLDADGRYLYVNRHLEEYRGVHREDILGRCAWEVFPDLLDTPFKDACYQAMQTQRMVHVEMYFPTHQNWCDLRFYPTHYGLSIYGQDTTERRRVEDALRESEVRFRHFVDSNIIGITVSNTDGRIYEANDAFLELVGYSHADVRAGRLNWDAMTPAEYRAREMQALEEELTTGAFQPFEKEYVTKTGERVPVLVGGTLFRWGGLSDSQCTETLMICFVLDMSARKAVERQKDLFLGMASHELKTPLAALKGTLQLAERRLKRLLATATDFSPDIATFITDLSRHLATSIRQVDLQAHLINDLLDVSRITANTLELSLQSCELAQIVKETVEDLRVTAPDRSLLLVLQEEMSAPVLVDAERISQVITNYITNAIRYSRPGQPVRIGLEVTDSRARVWVQDRGQGLSEEERQHIWQCFHRAKDVLVQSGSGKGLGLGLYICQTLITHHQGEVGVESTPGQGCTFWFTLPLIKEDLPIVR